jgi:hypothetical protein
VKVTATFDISIEELYRQRLLLTYLAGKDKSGIVDGVLQITDVIADKCADHGFPEALLTDTQKEHKLGNKLLADLMCSVLKNYAKTA